ncbi:MAG: hypothetical protein ABFE13_23490 [Phycisphaerales bacterium]
MIRHEQMQFINRELKGLWPQWKPTEAEVRVWLADLAAFDYAVARAAVQACFREQAANYHRPVLGKFLDKARSLSQRVNGRPQPESRDVTATVFIECHEPPAGRPHLTSVRKPVYVRPASRQSDPDYVLACAEHMRTEFERLYGGHWIAIRTDRASINSPEAPRRAWHPVPVDPLPGDRPV